MMVFEPAVMGEVSAALCAFYCGLVLGAVYDVFGLLRLPFSKLWIIGILDLAYYAVAAAVTWGFMLYINCGTLRIYIFAFMGFGVLAYTRFAGKFFRVIAGEIKRKFTKKQLHPKASMH